MRDPHEHTRSRRMWDHAFTKSALSEYEVPLVARVGQLVEGIAREARGREGSRDSEGGVVDLADWIKRFTCAGLFFFIFWS